METWEHRSVLDYLDLADFETKLRKDALNADHHLDDHSESDSSHSCVNLMRSIQQYLNLALAAYKSDPESLSLMLITVMELWKALDTKALMLYPLLAEYDPGFPTTFSFHCRSRSSQTCAVYKTSSSTSKIAAPRQSPSTLHLW